MRSIEPGISRFRVWSFGPSRNDDVEQVLPSLLCRLRGLERRIIRIALRAAAIERRLVKRIERCALLQALDEVRVRDEWLAERDQFGRASVQHFGREIEILAVVGAIGLLEALSQGQLWQ